MTSASITIFGILFAGIATGLGALPLYFKKEFSKKTLDVGLGFSAGVMLVASFISLIIPGIESARSLYQSQHAPIFVLVGIILGYLMIILIHEFLPHEHLFKKTDMKHDRKISRVTLIVLAISLHNFPEGLAVGVGFGSGDVSQGLGLALAIALQNMPEGLVVGIGLLSEGSTKNRAFLMALLSGLVEPIAAAIGYSASYYSQMALPFTLGFAGGTMLFVICQEMLPEIFRQGHERDATFGVILGVVTMFIIDFYL